MNKKNNNVNKTNFIIKEDLEKNLIKIVKIEKIKNFIKIYL